MKIQHIKLMAVVIALCGVFFSAQKALADGEDKVSVTVVPVDYISVKGDAEKFRAQNWKNDGYSGGLQDLTTSGKINKDTTFSFETHGIPNNNDYGGDLEVVKEKLGFLKLDYDMFRKYYDGSGGTYYPFTRLSAVHPDKDLNMDIGHIGFELGETLGNLPESSFFYDHHSKEGTKTRLTWAAAKEGTTTRMIGPAWQDVDEKFDSFGLRSKGEFAGFNVKGEQKWDVLNEQTLRQEKSLSTNSTVSEKKIRLQETELVSNNSVTTLNGEKWFWQDTGMFAMAYRHSKIDNKEHATIRETDENGIPRSFSYPENKFAGYGDNKYSSDIVTSNFQSQPLKDLLFNAKLKTEIIGRKGGSRDPSDTTDPPNGIANTTEISQVENKVNSLGGDLGLRYSGFKKTSIYGDVEVNRFNNWLYENRDSLAGESAPSTGEIFFRETNVYSTKYVLTAGTRTVLSKYLNFTTQIRHKNEDNDYDDERETPSTSSSSKSAFMEFSQVSGTEMATKWTVKPLNKLTGSIRYQYADNEYVARTEDSFNQRALTLSHTFTYDLMYQPLDSLLLDLGYMRQLAKTSTPAGKPTASPQIPGFTANVNTWSMSASYIFSPKLSFNSSFNKASQDNFNDFTATGMPYGIDARWYDVSAGLKWTANKIVTIEPKYTYYSYEENPKTDLGGGYKAHEVWLGVNLDWM